VGIGDGRLVLGAVERVGPDGDVLAIDASVDALEELRAASTAPNVSYLVGEPAVLPLPDAWVDEVLAGSAPEDEAEFTRVTRR
jgi:ubiquinone/menaquinone biosynthesis C-methylase UbiE